VAEPEKIASVVDKVILKLKKNRIRSICDDWEGLLGADVAKHSVPVSIRKDKLLVLVDSSVWLQHLNISKRDMIEKLSSLSVEDIVFKQGKIR